MGTTLIQKILSHNAGRSLEPGDTAWMPLNLMWGSAVTSEWANDALRANDLFSPPYLNFMRRQAHNIFSVFDHFVRPVPEKLAPILESVRETYAEIGAEVFEPGHGGGIQHRVFEDLAMVPPGSVGIGADSHSCTYGALAAAVTGVGSLTLAGGISSGQVLMTVPETIRVNLTGSFRDGVSAKDLSLYLCGLLGESGANYRAIEFSGPGVANVPMYQRFTSSNLGVEKGADFAIWPVDDNTLRYLKVHSRAHPERSRFAEEDVDFYLSLTSDPDADFLHTVNVNLDDVPPMVALPYSPSNVLDIFQLQTALGNMRGMPASVESKLARLVEAQESFSRPRWPIELDDMYFGGCTSTRFEDMVRISEFLERASVSGGRGGLIRPASDADDVRAREAGVTGRLEALGWKFDLSKCGYCFGGSQTYSEPGVYALVTNRNFEGRSGDGVYVLLVGAETAAISQAYGVLTSPVSRDVFYVDERAVRDSILAFEDLAAETQGELHSKGYHSRGERLSVTSENPLYAWRFGPNVNTDLMMDKKACLEPSLKEAIKRFMGVAGNSGFVDHLHESHYNLSGDVIVAGHNFGCGSSRHNAAEAFRFTSSPGVVAGSFGRIFRDNMLAVGLPVYAIGDSVSEIEEGHRLALDPEGFRVHNLTTGVSYQAQTPRHAEREILNAGGLLPLIKSNSALFTVNGFLSE